MSDQTPELLTLRKVSEALKVHPNTLRKWDKKGILKSIRFGYRKDRYYRKDDILKLIDGDTDGTQKEPTDHSSISYNMRKTVAEQALDRLNCIQIITTAFSRALTPKEVINIIINRQDLIPNCIGIAVLLFREGSNYCQAANYRGFADEVINSWEKIPLDQSNPFSNLLQTGEPVIIESSHDLLIRHSLNESANHFTRNQSLALLPLSNLNVVVGMIILGFESPQKFNRDDVSFMFSLAKQCSQALERANLYVNEKKAHYESEVMNQMLTNIHKSSLKFLVPLTIEETYRTILEEATLLVGSDYGNIIIFNEAMACFQRIYSTAPKVFQFDQQQADFVNHAFITNQPVVNQIKKNPQKEHLELGTQTVVYVPMTFKKKTAGVIVLIFLQHKEFNSNNLKLLKIFGSFASLALQNAKEYSVLREF